MPTRIEQLLNTAEFVTRGFLNRPDNNQPGLSMTYSTLGGTLHSLLLEFQKTGRVPLSLRYGETLLAQSHGSLQRAIELNEQRQVDYPQTLLRMAMVKIEIADKTGVIQAIDDATALIDEAAKSRIIARLKRQMGKSFLDFVSLGERRFANMRQGRDRTYQYIVKAYDEGQIPRKPDLYRLLTLPEPDFAVLMSALEELRWDPNL